MENRAAYIEFIEHHYFGNVTTGDVERVMAELASIAFNVEERTQDRIRALELLAKHGGAFVERSEIKVQAHKAIDAPPACATYEEWFGQREHGMNETAGEGAL